MGRKQKSEKSIAKKQERLAMERKMNERVSVVKAANALEDPLATLPSFRAFRRNNYNISFKTETIPNMDNKTKEWLMDLIERNMKSLYEKSSWGWSDANKREEMLDDRACYLLAQDENKDGKLVAFSHYRFDMDYDDEVLYVYEIQLEDDYKRKGLGKFMMQVLEMMAFKCDMRKIMLTVFKHNEASSHFFKKALNFQIDETCPIDDVYEQFDYEILSKFNKRKLAREAQAENSASVANS